MLDHLMKQYHITFLNIVMDALNYRAAKLRKLPVTSDISRSIMGS